MKKKILGGVAVIAIAALAAFNMDVNNKQELSAIGLANVEALANGESGSGSGKICYNTVTTQPGSTVLYCGTCTDLQNTTKSTFSGSGICP